LIIKWDNCSLKLSCFIECSSYEWESCSPQNNDKKKKSKFPMKSTLILETFWFILSWFQYFGNGKSYNKFVVVLQTGIFKGIQWKNLQSYRPYLVHIMRLYQFYTGLLCVGCVSYILYSCSMFFVTWERWPEINQKLSRIKVDFIGNIFFFFFFFPCV
jgi:hypothetical protein